MRCPGQDRGSWTGEVVFETPCPKCDATVEFFKDESSGKCPKCGHRFNNPNVSFDCAKWCAYAEECLGVAPQRDMSPNPAGGELVGRLVRAVKDELDPDQRRIARAMLLFQYARELLSKKGGDPRIVFASALLMEVDDVRRTLREVSLDDDTVDCICHLIDAHRSGRVLETVEYRVVAEAVRRAAEG